MQLVGVEEVPFSLKVVGNSDREWEGVAILFNGKDNGPSHGLTVEFWGRDGVFPSLRFVIRECITDMGSIFYHHTTIVSSASFPSHGKIKSSSAPPRRRSSFLRRSRAS